MRDPLWDPTRNHKVVFGEVARNLHGQEQQLALASASAEAEYYCFCANRQHPDSPCHRFGGQSTATATPRAHCSARAKFHPETDHAEILLAHVTQARCYRTLAWENSFVLNSPPPANTGLHKMGIRVKRRKDSRSWSFSREYLTRGRVVFFFFSWPHISALVPF